MPPPVCIPSASVPCSPLESEDSEADHVSADQFRPPDDPRWPGHWSKPPEVWADDKLADAQAFLEVRPA